MQKKTAKKNKERFADRLPRSIGVVHLGPLPGSPRAGDRHPADLLNEVGERALIEAHHLEKSGFDGVILENFGDTPFFAEKVSGETIASMSVLAAAVKQMFGLKVGVNVLRNDAMAALQIASVTGCDFIRVNVLGGVAATDQGLVEGVAAELLRERARLGSDVQILADARVKHANMLNETSLKIEIEQLVGRSGADGVVLTGTTTGRSVDPEELTEAYEVCHQLGYPLFIGSGLNADNIADLVGGRSIGWIVGSAIRQGGQAGADLDAARLKKFAASIKLALSQKAARAPIKIDPEKKAEKKPTVARKKSRVKAKSVVKKVSKKKPGAKKASKKMNKKNKAKNKANKNASKRANKKAIKESSAKKKTGKKKK